MKAILAGLAIGGMIVGIIACGPPTPPNYANERNEILTLWTQIRGWRVEAKMDVDPPANVLQAVRGKTARDARLVCKEVPKESASCSDVCSIADAICDNADAICILADKLGKNDTFAMEKCTSAKASCREAKQNCCEKCAADDAAPTGAAGVQGSLL